MHCQEKMEDALRNLYQYASSVEYNVPFDETSLLSSLQQRLENAAMDIERQERCIVNQTRLTREARTSNMAIRTRRDISDAAQKNTRI